MPKRDMRWLMRQGQTWYAVVEVPAKLRATLGKRRIKRTLDTPDLNVARVRRLPVVAKMQAALRNAQAEVQGDPLTVEALEWRAALKEFDAQGDGGSVGEAPDVREQLADRAYALDEQRGLTVATAFHNLATGKTTLIDTYIDAWLADGGVGGGALEERTIKERRRALAKFQAWLGVSKIAPTVEAVTAKVAGRYVSEAMLPSGRSVVTIIKALGALSGYWRWLIKRGNLPYGSTDPWQGQAPMKRKSDGSGRDAERAFTDEEVARLLADPPGDTFPDFLRIAALTGMRREEIGQLTVADCAGGVFVIRDGKTDAAARRVPVHSALAALVTARMTGKVSGAFLFDEIRSKNPERTDPLGKMFIRYRRSLGIQEGSGRRSQVNFHSLRRWFITSAVNAKQPPHMVSLVVGHTEGRKGMTLGRYWAGADDAALREVVEAVKLPTLATPATAP